MIYLFNSAVEAQSNKPDIFLTEAGKPVLATYLSYDFSGVRDIHGVEIPPTRKLAGSFNSQSFADHQLTKGGELTMLGLEYCNVMGVQKNYESLDRFIATSKHPSVDIKILQDQLRLALA